VAVTAVIVVALAVVVAALLPGRDRRLAAFRVVVAMVAVALQGAGWPASVRAPVVLAFVAIVPGWAILAVWDLARGWAGIGLMVAVSISLAIVVPSALMYAGTWSPFTALVILAAVTEVASIAVIVRPIPAPG
jgi:hypothetical protein